MTVSVSAYRAAEGLSGTSASKLWTNPTLWHFEQDPLNAKFCVRKSTPAMEYGTAVHLAILEPLEFSRRVVLLRHADSYATKDGLAAKKELSDLIESRKLADPIVLKPIDLASVERMAESFRRSWVDYNAENFDALESFNDAQKELPLFSHYSDIRDVNVKLKGQLDILSTTGIVCDIKTTSAFDFFSRDIERNGYDVQLSHYQLLAKDNKYNVKSNILFFAVESVPPFRCATHLATIVPDKWCAALKNSSLPNGPWECRQ